VQLDPTARRSQTDEQLLDQQAVIKDDAPR
jgi:hypothetical protein